MTSASVDRVARHRRAIAFMIIAAICWSTGGILVRQLAITNAWEIVFWRSLFMVLFVAGVLLAMHGRAMPRAVRAVGRPGLLAGLLLSGTFFLFIGSLMHTTVANTFVLMSVTPLIAALAGLVFLREPVPLRTWFALAAAGVGIRRHVRRRRRYRAAGRQRDGAGRVGVLCRAADGAAPLPRHGGHAAAGD